MMGWNYDPESKDARISGQIAALFEYGVVPLTMVSAPQIAMLQRCGWVYLPAYDGFAWCRAPNFKQIQHHYPRDFYGEA